MNYERIEKMKKDYGQKLRSLICIGVNFKKQQGNQAN
jgi:hypothetical protein